MERPCPVLPDDVIEDIFTRLPATTALGCRGLSRFWAAALSSDAFVDRHRRAASRHGGPKFFLLRTKPTPYGATVSFITTARAWSPVCCSDDGFVSLPRLTPSELGMMYGVITQQCRGLVVVESPDHKFEVYNPSTGLRTPLPSRHLTRARHLPVERRYESVGIGYDARTGKHKVVRIYYRGEKLPVQCDVYVVDDDVHNGEGFWRAPAARGRRPEARAPAGWVSSYETSVFAQGHVHWMAQKQKPKQEYSPSPWRVTRRGHIVSFSVADETFEVLTLPPRVDYLGDYRLTELQGRLCLFTVRVDNIFCLRRTRRTYDVSLLRDHETGTWDLHCRIDLDTASTEVARFMRRDTSPFAAMDDGRRILFMSSYADESRPYVYTVATGVMEHLPSGEGPVASHTYGRSSSKRMATLYEESVVSPGRPHEDILFSSTATPPRGELGRLKLVCRRWRAVIESDRFIELSAPSYGPFMKAYNFHTPSYTHYPSLLYDF